MTQDNDFKNLQKDHYKDMVDREDIDKRRWRRNHKRKIEAMDDYLDIKENDKVLEVGVGTGVQARYLLEHNQDTNFHFTGIDLSEDLLGVTREKLNKYENVEIKAMDAENLEFDDESIDKVFIGSTIHHLANPEKGVTEMIRVLKKGGRFCFMEPNYIHPKNVYFCHKYEAEKNMRFMKKKYFNEWLKDLNVDYKIQNFIYTPNRPDSFVPIYNATEKVVSKIPLVNTMSIMLFVYGEKR